MTAGKFSCRRSRATQPLPFATMSGGHSQTPRLLSFAGARQTTGSTHRDPLFTVPSGQARWLTHSLPFRTVLSGQMH
jgi:hypothetical protein